jgi:hypothetical protein
MQQNPESRLKKESFTHTRAAIMRPKAKALYYLK